MLLPWIQVATAWSAVASSAINKIASLVTVNTALPAVAFSYTPTIPKLTVIVASAAVVLSQKVMEAWKSPPLVTSKVADPAEDESLKTKSPPSPPKFVISPAVALLEKNMAPLLFSVIGVTND